MKTRKMSFGFSAVNAGQRNVAVEPQLIATSTPGGFRLTGPVTKLLGIGAGDYVMFINNVAEIDAALMAKTEDVVAFAEENGLALDSAELAIAMHKEFDMWAIAKGIAQYNSKGTALTVKERLSHKDKVASVAANFDEALEAGLSCGIEDVVAALTREGIEKDEQIEILASLVEGREVPKYQGSKTANPSGMTGTGVNLTFTDSNVWNQLKLGLDAPETINRVFDVLVDELEYVVLNNGFEDVKVAILPLGEYADKAPTKRGAEADEE